MKKRVGVSAVIPCAAVLAGLFPLTVHVHAAGPHEGLGGAAQVASAPDDDVDCDLAVQGSPYIPVDSWIYPAVMRLYSLGYLDTAYVGMRPWTRSSLRHILDEAIDSLDDAQGLPGTDEAEALYQALRSELKQDEPSAYCADQKAKLRVESVYTTMRGISGTPLRDSFHLGSTIVNDYGRPYANGFSNYSGASGFASAGRFVLYVRGEFQGAQSATGYSAALSQALSTVDGTTYLDSATGTPYNQTTIPMGPIGSTAHGRFLEAYISAQYLNHVFSFGKQDNWLGPALGGGMAYSNNAENIYSFRINRIEPLQIPLLSRVTGSFRYDFMIGPLRGHTYMPLTAANQNVVVNPGNPWVHVEKISFKPTQNLELGFERTVIWGGKGHEPITLHSFFKSFFSLQNVSFAEKTSSADPGARFGAFDFTYRLPFARNWLTLYVDSEVHDDVSPIDAPRRAAYRPGLYLSHVPCIPKLDIRVEAASTDPNAATDSAKQYGQFMYWEYIQKQGYTNQGQMFGDWIGREDKGGQGWITYHLSGNEWIQVGLRNQKATKDFIPGSTTRTFNAPNCPYKSCLVDGGTTLNDINFQVVKRVGKDLEIKGDFAVEHYNAPIYLPGQQTVTTTTVQLTWRPGNKFTF